MVVEISTFGSCGSRNIFNSSINVNYKDFFHINMSIETVTFISLMSDPIDYDEQLINSNHEYDNYCVIADLSNNFLDFLKTNVIEYLIIDTYFDVFHSLIVIDKNKFISDSVRLRKTRFYDFVKNKPKINIINDFDEYYALFKKSIDLFFKFIKDNCPNTRIILNCCRAVSKYEFDGKIITDENLEKRVNLNKYRDILDEYILNNYDVDVLNFDEKTLVDKNHIFGLHEIHYESEYYHNKTKQLNEIIERNDVFNYTHKFNVKFRELERENLVLKFNKGKQIDDKSFLALEKYLTARIDIKNEKLHNGVKIIENSDSDSLIEYPPWFEDEKGSGLTIHSTKGGIVLKVKCYGDGELLMRFMGKDVRDDDGVRIPVYINYNEIYINDEKISERPKRACHDFPICYKKLVLDGEIVKIRLKWSLF